MSNRKNYNSIVFLTTLSVYLGLVLVGGATPSVLAQAATTRDFNIKNEIVIEDDLDKKPNDDEIGSFFEIGLDKAIADFIEDLRQLKQEGKYKPNFKDTFSTRCAHSFCSIDEASASIAIEYQESKISDALWALHEKLDIAANKKGLSKILFIGFPENPKGCKEISLDLKFSQKELEIAVRFSKESTQKAFVHTDNLNRKFTERLDEAKNLLIKQIYENTKAHTENNQVFIVTRLPRASIDDLLAGK